MTDPAPEDGPEQEVADALEDFRRRRALGESPSAAEYRGRLGSSHGDFERALAVEGVLGAALEAQSADALPRPFGAYTLLRELGHGSVGIVYEAEERESGRRLALKLLRTGFDGPEAVERFRREAKACARIRHPHVVEVYEAGEAEGRPYCAMELVAGETLAAMIRAGRAPPPKPLCASLARVADALDTIHQAGIVHRDVKPSNVLVRPDGRMVLTDFGLARAPGALTLTETGDALGTPLYMSPEQVLGLRDRLDARTDVYGLGATLYHALAGRPPLEADTTAALMHAILTRRPRDPRRIAPALEEGCARIALKALEKRSDDRYAGAAAMRDDLSAFAEGRDVRARPVPTWRRGLRLLASARGAAALALILLAGAGAIAGRRLLLGSPGAGPTATVLGNGRLPRVAAAGTGLFAAAWEDSGRVWASCRTAAGWEIPRRLDPSEEWSASPAVAGTEDGRVLVVWVEGQRSRGPTVEGGVWAAARTSRGEWEPAVRLQSTPRATTADFADVALGPDGRAVAIWSEFTDTSPAGPRRVPVFASLLTEGAWGAPITLDTGRGRRSLPNLHAAYDRRGEALALWSSDAHVVAATGRDTTWTPPVRLEENKGYPYGIRSAVHEDGRVVVVWHQADEARRFHVWANRRDAAGAWGKARLIEADNRWGGNGFPRVGLDAGGNAIAVWAQENASRRHDVWSARCAPDGEWGTPRIVDSTEGTAGSPDICVARDGRAVAVWEQDDAVTAVRYAPGSGWGRPFSLPGVGQHPQLAVDPSGTTVAVWHAYDRVFALTVP